MDGCMYVEFYDTWPLSLRQAFCPRVGGALSLHRARHPRERAAKTADYSTSPGVFETGPAADDEQTQQIMGSLGMM